MLYTHQYIMLNERMINAPSIVYPTALAVKAGRAAAAFLDYIKSAKAAPFFEVQGFTGLCRSDFGRPL